MIPFLQQRGYWSDTGSPFHQGELQLQQRFGVLEYVHSYAPKFIRPFMPEQHREFYQDLPFMVVAARDEHGKMWSTLLFGNNDDETFVTSPNPTTLVLDATPVPGDALGDAFQPGDDLGILGIEFAAKRRNRVNGRIVKKTENSMEFRLDQSFGNCPQYIRPRKWWKNANHRNNNNTDAGLVSPIQKQDCLTSQQAELIRQSDTLFLASGFRGNGDDPRYGNDASHRGGPKGWIHVLEDQKTIVLPDFHGNNHYNTLGNLILDNRMGVTVPLLETGGMIQMTGKADLVLDEEEASAVYPGAQQLIVFHMDEVVHVPDGTLPLQWTLPNQQNKAPTTRSVRVTQKVKESQDVTSFHLQALEGSDPELWPFHAGQHLPIEVEINGNNVMRTYSLSGTGGSFGNVPDVSSSQNNGLLEYRITVKREPFGLVSTHLHDRIDVGDTLRVHQPAGDFVLDNSSTHSPSSDRTLVLVSAGVGLTPILSMLHAYDDENSKQKKEGKGGWKQAIWIHGARDGDHHPLEGEVLSLLHQENKSNDDSNISAHIVYSHPRNGDDDGRYDSVGRIDAKMLQRVVPGDLKDADIYMCGPGPFLADVQEGLDKQFGVDPKQIRFETF